MKSAALRDAMNARVKDAFAKWRTFADMPDASYLAHDIVIGVKADLSVQQNYVEALHSICAVSTPVGRIAGLNQLAGIASPEALEARQRPGREAELQIKEAAPEVAEDE